MEEVQVVMEQSERSNTSASFGSQPPWVWSKIGFPHTEGRERLKEEADHSSLVGDKFNKEGNKSTLLVLGGHKMSRYSHLPTRILNWRTAFLIIRELLVFSKNRLCWLSPKPCWLNLVRDPMCVPVGNRTCPPSAEETGVDSFRKLACLCTPYTLPGEAVLSGMRRWAGGEIY